MDHLLVQLFVVESAPFLPCVEAMAIGYATWDLADQLPGMDPVILSEQLAWTLDNAAGVFGEGGDDNVIVARLLKLELGG
jgi:hypothetical protein